MIGRRAVIATTTGVLWLAHGLRAQPAGKPARIGLLSLHTEPTHPGFVRRALALADKVLRSTPPGDIPIEQPTLIRLVLNRATARAIGLTIPLPLLLRADEVIE